MTRLLMRLMMLLALGCSCLIAVGMGIGHLLTLPDNELVFAAYLRIGRSEIYRMDIAHQLIYRVTNIIAPASNPTWSPDGQQIAFVGIVNQPPNTIYVIDAQGSALHRLTDIAQNNFDFNPVWSPDGRFIAYISLRYDFSPELVLTDLLSGTTRRLTDNHEIESSPAWSPDGQHLVYASGLPVDSDIYSLDIQTGESHPLIATTDNDLFPAWSPDGRYLLYASGNQRYDIYLWDSIRRQSILLYTPYSPTRDTPDWSPDGRFILFPAATNDGQAIFKLEVAACLQQPNTCKAERVTMKPGYYIDPRWRPRQP